MSIKTKYLEILEYVKMPEFLKKYLIVPSLLRLKKVGYFCGMDYASRDIYDFGEYISRYDHSLNVSLLTWKFTNDKSQTLAALFHDISTPCFSHVIDYMNKDYQNQESTEIYTEDILKNDKYLIECLEKDNLSILDIINFKKYSIVDNNRPKLCADRLDGVILTGLYWTKELNISVVKKIIDDIAVFIFDLENEIGFKSRSVYDLVVDINNGIDKVCHSKEDNYMMELLASITRNAICKNIITYNDLYRLNEEELFNIFKNCGDKEILKLLKLFKEIKLDEIPDIDLPLVKKRELSPLLNGMRL